MGGNLRPDEEGIATYPNLMMAFIHLLRGNLRPDEEGIATNDVCIIAETDYTCGNLRPDEEGIATISNPAIVVHAFSTRWKSET